MALKVKTGGIHEFVYDKNHKRELTPEDEAATKQFTDALAEWQAHPYKFWWQHNKKKVLIAGILLAVILVLFLTIFK